jgi:hypothetical protein
MTLFCLILATVRERREAPSRIARDDVRSIKLMENGPSFGKTVGGPGDVLVINAPGNRVPMRGRKTPDRILLSGSPGDPFDSWPLTASRPLAHGRHHAIAAVV